MDQKIKILHLEDSLKDSELILSVIESGGIFNDYFLADNEKDFNDILETENIDIILSDYSLPNYNGIEALKAVRENYAQIPFIFISGIIGEDVAINAMLNGATDYVFKNKMDRLVPAIKRALNEHELEIKRKQAEINLKEKNEQIEAQNEKYIQINKELVFQNEEKEKRAAELIIANKELAFQNEEKEKRAAELIIANKELIFQNKEKEKRAAELIIANKELAFQNEEKEKRAAELIIANKELIFQNEEKEKRAAELIIADKELDFQHEEKGKRASELIIANKELLFQNEEKEKRAEELVIADKELLFQNEEKEKRASELIIADKELVYQNEEKEKRASELIIADKELDFQQMEKGKRAEELIIANKELTFQNKEKEKRAAELIVANKELAYQNEEKEKRAAELIIANKELVFQNDEKEQRAKEYSTLNKVLTESLNQIQDINNELIISKNKAEESDKLKSAFLANMSHEIRTPLNAIMGFSGFLVEPDLSKENLEDFVQIINANSRQLLSIISDIMDFSKMEAGQFTIDSEIVNINRLLTDLFVTYKKIVDLKKLDLEYSFDRPNELIQIKTDGNRIKQVICNLLNNAIKFTKEGKIEFGYKIKNNFIEFYVKDTGIGIDQANQTLVFERFRQVDAAKNQINSGNGLGLSISKALVEKLGGKITVDSKLGMGSVFLFTIPYINETQNSAASEFIAKSEKCNWDGKTILLVEDEVNNHAYAQQLLKATKVNVIHAWDGSEAVELVKSHPDISLVLMDIKMPVMDGYEATRLIKQIRPELPVIAQTAYALSQERKQALEAGCDNYITKPIDRELFMKLLNSFLS